MLVAWHVLIVASPAYHMKKAHTRAADGCKQTGEYGAGYIGGAWNVLDGAMPSRILLFIPGIPRVHHDKRCPLRFDLDVSRFPSAVAFARDVQLVICIELLIVVRPHDPAPYLMIPLTQTN